MTQSKAAEGPYKAIKIGELWHVKTPTGQSTVGTDEKSATQTADLLSEVHHSARLPLLELLRECEGLLGPDGYKFDVLVRADLLTRIRRETGEQI